VQNCELKEANNEKKFMIFALNVLTSQKENNYCRGVPQETVRILEVVRRPITN
jgi:hypothetical protein